MFINLIYYALVNSNIVYTKLGNDILLLNFKIVVAKALIGRYINLKNLLPTSGSGEQISHEPSMPREVLTYTHEFQKKRIRCHYYKNEGSDHKIFASCQTCLLYLCLTKGRKCFFKASFVVFHLVVFHHDYLAYYIPFWNKLFLPGLLGLFL